MEMRCRPRHGGPEEVTFPFLLLIMILLMILWAIAPRLKIGIMIRN